MRYYLGTRDPKVMAEKLPMALIHEGVGEVVFDPTETFKTGDKVVMVPNMALIHNASVGNITYFFTVCSFNNSIRCRNNGITGTEFSTHRNIFLYDSVSCNNAV